MIIIIIICNKVKEEEFIRQGGKMQRSEIMHTKCTLHENEANEQKNQHTHTFKLNGNSSMNSKQQQNQEHDKRSMADEERTKLQQAKKNYIKSIVKR